MNVGAQTAGVEHQERIALVVDDDDRAAEVLRQFLEAEGFAVVRAISAEDAVLMVPRQPLALITLDLQLYGMNGWQLLSKLRESGALAHVPMIIVSGRTIDDVAQGRGAAAVLQKPVSRVQLKATLSRLGLIQIRSGFAQ
jgi:DNA-binding response OmpR family regulator